jgi:ribose 5-phosphate isomerase B
MMYIGSDHAGYQLKETIKKLLDERGEQYTDLGTNSEESVDFTDYAFAVAEKVGQSSAALGAPNPDIGILVCGSGVGMDIAANKVKGVRAALATTPYMGRQSREHDDANVLVLAGRVITPEQATEIAKEFLDARFGGEERHARRVQKIINYEQKHLS